MKISSIESAVLVVNDAVQYEDMIIWRWVPSEKPPVRRNNRVRARFEPCALRIAPVRPRRTYLR